VTVCKTFKSIPNKQMNKRKRTNKNKKSRGGPRGENKISGTSGRGNTYRSTYHYVGSISMSNAATLLQVNIAPVASLFPGFLSMAPKFATYKITRVNWKLLPRFNISTMSGTLPMIYQVPLTA
jgi:hypothetical protein